MSTVGDTCHDLGARIEYLLDNVDDIDAGVWSALKRAQANLEIAKRRADAQVHTDTPDRIRLAVRHDKVT